MLSDKRYKLHKFHIYCIQQLPL